MPLEPGDWAITTRRLDHEVDKGTKGIVVGSDSGSDSLEVDFGEDRIKSGLNEHADVSKISNKAAADAALEPGDSAITTRQLDHEVDKGTKGIVVGSDSGSDSLEVDFGENRIRSGLKAHADVSKISNKAAADAAAASDSSCMLALLALPVMIMCSLVARTGRSRTTSAQ